MNQLKTAYKGVVSMGYFTRGWIMTLIILFATVLHHPAAANSFVDIFSKEIPVFDKISDEEFNTLARTYKAVPFDDKSLAYEIKLPKIWKEGKSFGYSISEGIFTDIGRYTGPIKFNKESSYVVIKAMQIGLQASAKIMAASTFMTNGFTVQGATAHSRNHIETLHVEVIKGETYIVRSLFLINGGRLIVMAYYLPQSSWMDERDLQYRVVESFKLQNEISTKITDTKQYDFWDIASVGYPKNGSWNLATNKA